MLTKDQFVNAMQVGLMVSSVDFVEAKRRLKAINTAEHYPPYLGEDQSTFYYFHCPGGQIFRLVNKDKMGRQ
ncbi:MAG: hypothetical protein RJQ09_10700 [Cyclobacteriaceae bacterium]